MCVDELNVLRGSPACRERVDHTGESLVARAYPLSRLMTVMLVVAPRHVWHRVVVRVA